MVAWQSWQTATNSTTEYPLVAKVVHASGLVRDAATKVNFVITQK